MGKSGAYYLFLLFSFHEIIVWKTFAKKFVTWKGGKGLLIYEDPLYDQGIGILFERKGECIIFLENFHAKEIYCTKGWKIWTFYIVIRYSLISGIFFLNILCEQNYYMKKFGASYLERNHIIINVLLNFFFL